MNKIRIKSFQLSPEKVIEIRDLRNTTHPEFEDFENIRFHVNSAIHQNGLRYYDNSIFEDIIKQEKELKHIGFIHHLYHLLGGAKGVIKYRMKHKQSSLSRYKNHSYAVLNVLRAEILIKHKRKIYKGCIGYPRIELIESINDMCKGIKNPKVLEAGCGSGINLYLLNSLNKDIELHGFEYTNARIASSIVNLFYSNINQNLFLADVCEIKLPDNSYDVVYSNHVLEQLGQNNAKKALKEMWRVCKKGIVLSEPSIHGANFYEKWRMNSLGYCKDLYSVAKQLPNAKILVYKEDTFRTYPNTSHHLVIEKKV